MASQAALLHHHPRLVRRLVADLGERPGRLVTLLLRIGREHRQPGGQSIEALVNPTRQTMK
jgi:hypothetical protein